MNDISGMLNTIVAPKLKEGLIRELSEQGHRLTGAVENSIAHQVTTIPSGYMLTITALSYAIQLERGVSAKNIPYRPGNRKGSGKTSQYIQGLIRFAELRGMKNPKSAAFAIAYKHSKEGMPTRGSYRYSSNGRRKNFIDATLDKVGTEIERDITSAIWADVDKSIKVMKLA